jgi:hypothetical protein
MAEKRQDNRSGVAVSIDCQPFSLVYETHQSEGILRNYSEEGAYVELPRPYNKGNILMMRLLEESPSVLDDEVGTCRSLSLAEVKWVRHIEGVGPPRYGIGLKMLS